MPEIVCILERIIEFQIRLCALWHEFSVIRIRFLCHWLEGLLFGGFIRFKRNKVKISHKSFQNK